MHPYSLIVSLLLLFQVTHAQQWAEKQKLVAADREEKAHFGSDVAISGNYAIVAAFKEDKNVIGEEPLKDAGAAYILERNANGKWTQVQKLTPDERKGKGIADYRDEVAIDGNAAAVFMGSTRMVYYYQRQKDGAWKEQQQVGLTNEDEKLTGPMVLDKTHLVVVGESKVHGPNQTVIFVFEKNTQKAWELKQRIISVVEQPLSRFGERIALSEGRLLVSAYEMTMEDNDGNELERSGAAFVFEKQKDGRWKEAQMLVSDDLGARDFFGYSVALSGNYAVVGAWLEDEDEMGANKVGQAGAAYVFERTEEGKWKQVQKLVEPKRIASNCFGFSVAIHKTQLAISSYDLDSDNSKLGGAGAVYVFERAKDGKWTKLDKLMASDKNRRDDFGGTLAMDKQSLITGAIFEDEDVDDLNTIDSAGSVYIFEYNTK